MTRGVVHRWFKFQAVGAAGTCVQLAGLFAFKECLGMGVGLATAAAVEIAILHNFWWHRGWTWARPGRQPSPVLLQLVQYNLTVSLASLISNVLLTGLYLRILPVHYLVANLMAIGTLGLVNFLMGELIIFRPLAGRETEPES
jgi:putative flippase GtrA